MKRAFNRLFTATLLIAIVALLSQACEKQAAPVVPGAENIECMAGDYPTISFTAGDSWHLSSDAVWCKFASPVTQDYVQEMSGSAGTHSVTLKITDENNGNKWSTANVTIRIGSSQGIIAVVKRKPSQLYLKILDVTESPLEPQAISLGYIDWVPCYIEANFRFATTDFPEWVEWGMLDESGKVVPTESLTGAPGDYTVGYARIINDGDRERFEIKVEDGHTVEFSDESSDAKFYIPIIYGGMGGDELTYTGPTERNYGWEVSLDGKRFRQKNENEGTTTTFSNELQFDIAARNNEFDIIYLEKSIDRGIVTYSQIGQNAYDNTNERNCWMHFDKEAMTLTIDEATTTRYGLVVALPRGIYNRIRTDILGNILGTDTSSGIEEPIINDDYQKYVIIELMQHDIDNQNSYDSMYIYHSITTHEILATEFTDNALLAEYGAEKGYECPFVNSIEGKKPGIVIDPRIEGWTTESFESSNASAEVWHRGSQLKISEDEYYLGENKDEKMALYLWGPKSGWNGESVHLVFKVDGVAKKLLIVTPPAN